MFVIGEAPDLGQWCICEDGPVIRHTTFPETLNISKPWLQAPGLAASEIT